MASLKYIQSSTLQSVTLGANYTAGDGSMTLTAGNGAYLPSSGDFWLSYNNGAGTVRLFKVTARSTDTLTVTAVSGEGSGDGNISSGETLRWALTVDALDQLKADIVASVPASGLVLLETQTASASSSLNFTSTITSSYDDYQFEFINVIPVTDAVSLYMRVSTDGGSTWVSTNSYAHATLRWNSGGMVATGGAAQTELRITQGASLSNSALWGVVGSTSLFAPLSTSVYTRISGSVTGLVSGAGTRDTFTSTGSYESTTAVNAVQFYFSSGNISSGIIRSYGISK